MELLLGYLLIFLARCSDVTCATIRTIMVIRGRKFAAAAIGFVEIIIYILAINKVLSSMDNIGNILSYAFGFATGNYVGIVIEEKMALGTIIAQIMTSKDVEEFAQYLREKGFGVTVMQGNGRQGTVYLLSVVLQRKDLLNFERLIDEYDKNAFVTMSDARNIKGGYFRNQQRTKKK